MYAVHDQKYLSQFILPRRNFINIECNYNVPAGFKVFLLEIASNCEAICQS